MKEISRRRKKNEENCFLSLSDPAPLLEPAPLLSLSLSQTAPKYKRRRRKRKNFFYYQIYSSLFGVAGRTPDFFEAKSKAPSVALDISSAFTSAGVAPGLSPRTSAAAPATSGALMLVPEDHAAAKGSDGSGQRRLPGAVPPPHGQLPPI